MTKMDRIHDRRPPRDVVDGAIRTAREAWRKDGTEGETVHLLCNEIEALRRELAEARAERDAAWSEIRPSCVVLSECGHPGLAYRKDRWSLKYLDCTVCAADRLAAIESKLRPLAARLRGFICDPCRCMGDYKCNRCVGHDDCCFDIRQTVLKLFPASMSEDKP